MVDLVLEKAASSTICVEVWCICSACGTDHFTRDWRFPSVVVDFRRPRPVAFINFPIGNFVVQISGRRLSLLARAEIELRQSRMIEHVLRKGQSFRQNHSCFFQSNK